jgi:quinol monooxygenase YgiN
MTVITAAVKALEGQEEQLRQRLETMVDVVRSSEPDCLEYTLHRGADDKTQFFFYEKYRSPEAFDLHTSTPHFKQLVADIEPLLAAPIDVQVLEIIK